jgi:hypothetical protein
MKIQNQDLLKVLQTAPESGPVYAQVPNSPTETIAANGNDIKLMKALNFPGYYLNINVEGMGTRAVTVRTPDPNKEPGVAFRLEVWEAMRDLPANGSRREIKKGTQKVFAVPLQ